MTNTKTTVLSATILINKNSEEVWSVVKDFGNISAFHPLVKSSYSTNEKEGLGAKRYCELSPMGSMKEVVTGWEEGRGFTAEVFDGKMLPPSTEMKGKLELESVDDQTQVTFTFSYRMKYGWLGALMNRLMIKPQFAKAPPKYVNGLKNYMESSLR